MVMQPGRIMLAVLLRFLWKVRFHHVDTLIMEDIVCLYLLDKAKQVNDALASVSSDGVSRRVVGASAAAIVAERPPPERIAEDDKLEDDFDATAVE